MSGPEPAARRADRPPVVFLIGPTAAGKTAAAVYLAARLPVRLVSVDSAMVYRGMDIGTGKPDAATLARAPHRLIDIRDPEQAYSAAEFRADALGEIARAHAERRLPVLVGGTGLYFRALRRGLSPLPSADPQVRARLAEEAAARGWGSLHARLAEVDPATAARVHPNDPQRIQRALEVFALTGAPVSALRTGPRATFPYPLIAIALVPGDRAALHAAIERRFLAMLDEGLEAEVQRLAARPGLGPGCPALRSVGYRQVWACLHGECDRDTMIARAVAATRQLAKRQLTWLRGESGIEVLECRDRQLHGRLEARLRGAAQRAAAGPG